MADNTVLTRRNFVGGVASGGVAAALGYSSLLGVRALHAATPPAQSQSDEYDSYAKLANNENPWGPPKSVMDAMTYAFKYANRYGYPDGNLVEELAKHHGVPTDHIMLGAGSGEILNVVGLTFLPGGKKVVGSDPSYGSVYSHATSLRTEAIRVPLLGDYRQDIPALITTTKRNYRDAGFVFLCNPNNPTGRIVPRREVEALLNGIPDDVPVLVDEAYHHFVEHSEYATSVPHVIAGRNVIVARTFSKISGLAGMRLGYAIARPDLIRRMRPYSTGSVNALVRWGGAAALKDTAAQEQVKRQTIQLRQKAVADLATLGFQSIPSDGNFFMVDIRRPVQPVIEEFRKRKVLVGRPFPPMLQHLRVSIGTAEEMARFMAAYKEIFSAAS